MDHQHYYSNMFRRKWRRLILLLYKFYRAFDLGYNATRMPKSKQDRMIIKAVSSILDSSGVKVIYSPVGPKVYIHTKDKRYMIILSRSQVSITNHRFFLTSFVSDHMGESLMNLSLIKLDEEVKKLEWEIRDNENHFLDDIYQSFRNKKMKSQDPKPSSIQEALKDLL